MDTAKIVRIVALVVALTTERFLNPGNLSNLSLQVSIVALIAIGSSIGAALANGFSSWRTSSTAGSLTSAS